MDIRNAQRKGTEPPALETVEKPAAVAPHIDEGTGATIAPAVAIDGEEAVIRQYMEYLKEHDVTEDDVKSVLEAVITTGNVEWTFDLYGRIPVAFQIRPAWVNDIILETVDRETAANDKVSMVRYNNLIAVCNLAASLTRYGEETYSVKNVEDFVEARRRVENMTYIVQSALINKLAVFDRTVAVATSDWSVRNFTTPRKDA